MPFMLMRPSCVLALLVLTACAGKDASPPRTTPTPSSTRLSLKLVDERTPDEGEADPYYRVEIRGARLDTVRAVLTTDEPTLVGDSLILGTLSDTMADQLAFFRYHVATRVLDTIPMPAIFHDPFSGIAISNDGRFVAWAHFDRSSRAAAEVRTFPGGELVSRSAETAVSPSGGRLAHPSWVRSDSAVIPVWADVVPERPWIRYHFVLATRSWGIDTLRNSQ